MFPSVLERKWDTFTQQTNIHGIRELGVYSRSRHVRFVWLWVVVVCMGGMGYVVAVCLRVYLDNPVITNIETIVPDRFVPVLLCPEHWANQSLLERAGISMEVFEYIYSLFGGGNRRTFAMSNKTQIELLDTELHELLLQRYKYQLPALISDILLDFDQLFFCPSDNCSTSVLLTTLGPCLHFNFTDAPNVVEISTDTWLIKLNLTRYLLWSTYAHYEKPPRNDSTAPVGPAYQLFIGDSEGMFITKPGLNLLLNQGYTLSLEGWQQTRMRRGSYQCRQYESAAQAFDSYAVCASRIRNQIVRQAGFGCEFMVPRKLTPDLRQEYLLQGNGLRFCSTNKINLDNNEPASIVPVADGQQRLSIEDKLYKETMYRVYYECPTPCRKWFYRVMNSVDPKDSTDLVQVTFSFRDPFSTLHYQEVSAISWVNFISNIGGIISLWCGASVISLLQIFYLCCTKENTKKQEKSGNDAARSLANGNVYRKSNASSYPANIYWTRPDMP